MSVRSNKPAAAKRGVPTAAILVAVVVLAVFVAWRAWATFGSHVTEHPPAEALAKQEKDMEFVRQKAVEVQGDFTRLSPQDQARVQELTHGFGRAAISSQWRQKQGR